MSCGVLLLLALPPAHAINVWDEGVDGDLSGDPLAPTVVAFGLGTNSVTGSVTADGDTRDYFTFDIASGLRLSGITLTSYFDVATGGDGDIGFAHIDDGATSVIPGAGTALDFLGGAHLDSTLVGGDLLALLATAPQGGVGFSAPLGAGTYTFNVQQTGMVLTGYSLDFEVTPVPLPAAVWLLASGALGLLGLRRRR